MQRVMSRAASVGGLALLAVLFAGCGQGGGGKIDLSKIEDNQVALTVEGMV